MTKTGSHSFKMKFSSGTWRERSPMPLRAQTYSQKQSDSLFKPFQKTYLLPQMTSYSVSENLSLGQDSKKICFDFVY